MTPPSSLRGANRRTFESIFQHPVTHNLGWPAVQAMFRHLGEAEEQPNGNLRITRHGRSLVLPATLAKDVPDIDELMKLRAFLRESAEPVASPAANEGPWVVLINHHQARLFPSPAHGTAALTLLPHAPEEFFRHAPHSQDFTRGREKPEPNSFFAPIVRALPGHAAILMCGSGTGTANEMEQFIAWLHVNHAAVAQRIIGSMIVDEHHLTDGQLLAQAREFIARTPSLPGAAS